MDYHNNGRLVFLCKYHVVFCTKYKRKIFKNGLEQFAESMFYNLALDTGFIVSMAEVAPNYVHLIIDCDPTYGIAHCIEMIKRESTKILKEHEPSLEGILPSIWTRNALIYTIGHEDSTIISKFVKAQKGDGKRV